MLFVKPTQAAMISRIVSSTIRKSVVPVAPLALRARSSLSDPKYSPKSYQDSLGGAASARHAMQKSCYYKIDFKIDEDAMVYEAVQRFAAYNLGALAVSSKGKVVGIISERDYVTKIALLGRSSKTTRVSEVATMGANLVVANINDSIEGKGVEVFSPYRRTLIFTENTECMRKMLGRDIRHLPITDETGDVVGMLSIKDIIKEVLARQNEVITRLTEFNIGRGAFFEHT